MAHSFLKFPTTLQTVEYSTDGDSDAGALDSFSSEGQQILIEASFQYRLRAGSLVDLYKRFRQDYHTTYISVGQSAIKNAATNFTLTDYFSQRETIRTAMQKAVQDVLEPLYADVEDFQLRAIDLPDAFESDVVNKIVKAQEAITERVKQQVEVIRQETNVLVGSINANISVVAAPAEADAFLIVQRAEAKGIEQLADAESQGLETIQSTLGFTTEQLLTYFYQQVVKTKKSARIVVGFEGSATLLSV